MKPRKTRLSPASPAAAESAKSDAEASAESAESELETAAGSTESEGAPIESMETSDETVAEPAAGEGDDRGRSETASTVDELIEIEDARTLSSDHLRGLLEALVFASDKPIATSELAKAASAPVKQVKTLMSELKAHYGPRGIVLQELAGGWLFRTNVAFAPFVRELTSERPVKLTRAQIETLAITAYRQPITRPEIDEIRGVDSGATLKLLLERELLRILGKKDEPGRPLIYGTTSHFLEFFGLKSLRDLPTLREFTELSEEPQGGEAERSLRTPDPVETLKAPPGPFGDTELEEQVPSAESPGEPETSHRLGDQGEGEGDPLVPARDTVIPSAPPTGDLEDPPDSDSSVADDD